MTKRWITVLGSAALLLAPLSAAFGQAVISTTNGSSTVYLGVNALGHLNTRTDSVVVNSSATGLAYDSPALNALQTAAGFSVGPVDSTSPGCFCEGWGASATVAGNPTSGYANESVGTANLSLTSFANTASTATSVVTLTDTPGLTITHAYAPSVAGALFEAQVTITNTTGATISDVNYVRVMDWDVPFTEFSELVTIKGTGTTTLLNLSTDNGFSSADPLNPAGELIAGTTNTDFEDVGPSDHGAYFRFGFGSLDDGKSITFKIFYGAAATEVEMLAALASASIELYSLGQSSNAGAIPGDPAAGSPITYAFGFSGVGGDPILPPPGDVPEPMTLFVWTGLIGLAGVGYRGMKNRTL